MAKIPPHATRVFKGVIFDVYQWQQDMYDGSKKTFEAMKRPDTVVIVPTQGDQVFYAKQEQPGLAPYVSLFGGRAEENEDPLEAAKRELFEETGFVSDNWRQIRHVRPLGKIDWNIYYYVAADCRKTGEQDLDGGEKISVHHLGIDAFINTIVTDPTFSELEMSAEVLSALDPVKAVKLKYDILGKPYPGDLTDEEWFNPANKGCCA